MSESKKFDRFDFEQQIMDCWSVTSDIRTAVEYIKKEPFSENRKETATNMLIGIQALYDAKFTKLFDQYEQLVHEHANTLDQPLWRD